MLAWGSTIKRFMQPCEMKDVDFDDDIEEGRPRAQSVRTRPRFPIERHTRKVKTSPATPDDMFREMIHSKNVRYITVFVIL